MNSSGARPHLLYLQAREGHRLDRRPHGVDRLGLVDEPVPIGEAREEARRIEMDDRGAPALASVTASVDREPLEITGDLVGGVRPVLPRHGAVEVDLAHLRPLERETPIERARLR